MAFFSEEKKQKTFMSLSRFYPEACSQEAKVFWFFFSKKNCFSSAGPQQVLLRETWYKPIVGVMPHRAGAFFQV
jgi:hypothetical protein